MPDYGDGGRGNALSPLIGRAELSSMMGDYGIGGSQFGGRRRMDVALGYRRFISPRDYWDRYRRGGIAKRIVDTFAKSTWRGGVELIEDEDPDTETEFEKAFADLADRLQLWSLFKRTDVLAGLGHFAIIMLGAPGDYSTPLDKCAPQDLKYVNAFSERDVLVESFNEDKTNERFSKPMYYSLLQVARSYPYAPSIGTRVHWSRISHVAAEDALDSPLYGTPRLEPCWNYLDDLIKCVGGGSEAFWKRVDGGKQIKMDPALPMPTQAQTDALHLQLEEYTQDLRRLLTTRGVDIQDLGSQVAQFGPSVSSLIDLISATTGIPQRILMGSERGELASTQDQSNFEDRVSDRRTDYAEPSIVRPFVDQLISLGVLPEPEEYHVRWPEVKNLNDAQRMALAGAAATVNKTQGEIVITTSEIRDKILGYEPFTEEQQAENDAKLKAEQDLAKAKATAQAAVVGGKPPFGDKPSGNGKDGTDGKNGKKGGKALDVAAMEAALIDDDIDLAAAIVAKALAEVGNGNGSPV